MAKHVEPDVLLGLLFDGEFEGDCFLLEKKNVFSLVLLVNADFFGVFSADYPPHLIFCN